MDFMYNLHKQFKNDTDSTDAVENDYIEVSKLQPHFYLFKFFTKELALIVETAGCE
jgi:hypothetical protein